MSQAWQTFPATPAWQTADIRVWRGGCQTGTASLTVQIMTQTTTIGRGTGTVTLELCDGVHIEQIPAAAATSAGGGHDAQARIVARVAQALAHPEQFLPLTDMVVPGDRVAIALDEGLPQPSAILAGILQVLEPCQLSQIDVVVPSSTSEQAVANLQAALPPEVTVTVHDVADRAAFGYLGADDDAEAIRVNRTLVDADLVLPVSVMRLTDPLLGGPSGDALYPGMVDVTQRSRLQRFIARAIASREDYHDQRAASQAHQVRWNLGVQLMMAVEVASGGEIGQIFVSSPDKLREFVRTHYAANRHRELPEAADVVVACIEGDGAQQTMENLMRAALAARSYAAPAGTIVLVSTLERLGPLRAADDQVEIGSELVSDAPKSDSPLPESLSQAEFATRVLHDLINEIDTSRRYLLMFGGEWEAAEAFGFGVIPDEAALVRLINQCPHCCVLHAAQTAANAGSLALSEA